MSDEKIKCSGETYSPTLSFDKEKIYLTFNSDILAQEKIVYNHESIVNIYVVYTLLYWHNSTTDYLKNCLFGATGFYKKWSGYRLAFGIKGYVHTESGKIAKNLIILGVDTSDGDKTQENNILVLAKGSFSMNRTETTFKFKAKCTEIKPRKSCPEGFSDDTSLISNALGNGKIYHFSVDYQLATIDKILKIHKYLMKKHNI